MHRYYIYALKASKLKLQLIQYAPGNIAATYACYNKQTSPKDIMEELTFREFQRIYKYFNAIKWFKD